MINKAKKEFISLSKMPKNLAWFGDPILRKKCKAIPLKNIAAKSTVRVVTELIRTLKEIRKFGRGVAIAAPQVGIQKNITVLYWGGHFIPYINPVIISKSKKQNIFSEGCLSGLPLVGDVIRPVGVRIQYYDTAGNKHEGLFGG